MRGFRLAEQNSLFSSLALVSSPLSRAWVNESKLLKLKLTQLRLHVIQLVLRRKIREKSSTRERNYASTWALYPVKLGAFPGSRGGGVESPELRSGLNGSAWSSRGWGLSTRLERGSLQFGPPGRMLDMSNLFRRQCLASSEISPVVNDCRSVVFVIVGYCRVVMKLFLYSWICAWIVDCWWSRSALEIGLGVGIIFVGFIWKFHPKLRVCKNNFTWGEDLT